MASCSALSRERYAVTTRDLNMDAAGLQYRSLEPGGYGDVQLDLKQ